LQVVLNSGLILPDFKKTTTERSFVIIHTPSGEEFDFGTQGPPSWTTPGINSTVRSRGTASSTWDDRLVYFKNWTTELKRYLDAVQTHVNTPDLWVTLQSRDVVIENFNSPDDNRPFTIEEQKYVSKQLTELKAFIVSTMQPSPGNLLEVSSRIQYLEEAATRMGRKDWNGILIATLFGFIIAGIFAPDRAHELFAIAGELFKGLFTVVAQLATS